MVIQISCTKESWGRKFLEEVMVGFTRSGVPSLFPSNFNPLWMSGPCEGCSAFPKYHNQAKLTGLVTQSGVAQVQ